MIHRNGQEEYNMSRSVSLHSELQQFKQDVRKTPELRSRIILKEGVSWQLFRMISHDKKIPDNNFYCFDTKIIGEGSFGQVYKAYRVIEHTGDIDFKVPYVVKKIACTSQCTKADIMTEVAILAQQYKTDVVQHIKTPTSDDYFVITEYVPGKSLFCDSTNRIHEGVATLSLVERLELIVQLIIQVNGFHHHRAMRNAFAHFDIRGDNLLLDISDTSLGKKAVRLSLIDFGTAVFFNSDNPAVLHEGKRGGMFSCFPPEYLPFQGEASKYHIGLKQDSYSLTPFVAILLGSKKPFRLKDDISGDDFWTLRQKPNKTEAEKRLFSEKLKDHIQATYDIHDVLDNAVYPYPYPQEIKQLMIDFLNCMQSSDYNTRPDSDELLVFFMTMLNFFKAYSDYNKLENYLDCLSQQPKRQALYQVLKKASIPECHRQVIQLIKERKGRGFEVFFNQEFAARYKAKCRFSLFGNLGRSDVGGKVMQGVDVTSGEVLHYVRHHPDGLASKILYDMRSLPELQDDALLSIGKLPPQMRR